MADFLTERTKFFCTAGAAVIFSISSAGSSNVTHNGSKVLTTDAKLSGKGICPILTAAAQGTPQQCKFKQMPWINFDVKVSADGNKLLTANSFCTCPIGGAVKVRLANAQGFQQGSAFSSTTSTQPTISTQSTTSDTSQFSDKFDSVGVIAGSLLTTAALSREKLSKAVQDTKSVAAKVKRSIELAGDISLRCPNCPRKTCTYRLDAFKGFLSEDAKRPTTLKTTLDGFLSKLENVFFDAETSPLRKVIENFTAFFAEVDNKSAILRRNLELSGRLTEEERHGYAAHHIISGNQCFAKTPRLAVVAMACGYDINCAENGIMLPTSSDGVKDRLSPADVMRLTGKQWHVGGHSYRLDDDLTARIRLTTGYKGALKCYADLLIDELSRREAALGNEVCPRELIVDLNDLSRRVRRKLDAFKDDPLASFPYYVSKEAYYFAFNPT